MVFLPAAIPHLIVDNTIGKAKKQAKYFCMKSIVAPVRKILKTRLVYVREKYGKLKYRNLDLWIGD